MIRSIRPTDLIALSRFNALAQPNQAMSPEQLPPFERASMPRLVRDVLSLEGTLNTWVMTADARIQGVVAARERVRVPAWDIERLQGRLDTDPDAVLGDLLGYVAVVAAENSVERLFLRTQQDAPASGAARKSGFTAYAQETACVLPPPAEPQAAVPEIRNRTPLDEHDLFRFYSQVVPADVRRVTGMVREEFEVLYPAGRSRSSQDRILQAADGRILGWSRFRRHGAKLIAEIITDAADQESIRLLLQDLGSRIQRHQVAILVIPHWQELLGLEVARLGGTPIAHFDALCRHLAVRVRLPAFVPVGI